MVQSGLKWLFLNLLLSFTLACSSHLNLQEGIVAFRTENYRQAFIRLKPEAEKGNLDAQYAIGYMYYYGKGVVQNRRVAYKWISHAASRGQIQAQEALKILVAPSFIKENS